MKLSKLFWLLVFCSPFFSSVVIAASTEQRLAVLERKFKALSDVTVRLSSLQRENQQLRGEIEVLNHSMQELKKRQRQLYLDLDSRIGGSGSSVATPKKSSVARVPVKASRPSSAVVTPKSVGETSQKAYQKAFAMIMQRRYKEASSGFSSFLKNYPQDRYSDNAQYWLAEAKYAQHQYDAALDSFAVVINRYPNSPKVADALLKTGFILYDKKKWKQSRQYLTRVVKQHSKTTASRLAKSQLDKMRSEGH